MTVVDTHAWIWWASHPEKLSARARDHLQRADVLGICPISCWEVAMLVAKGRLQLDRDVMIWVKQALGLPRVRLIALTPEIAVGAGQLPISSHGDPADRLIVASAVVNKAVLVSKDERIREFSGVRSIW